MNSICLVIDRLQAGILGPYGNTWIHTPHWNRLASESFLFDQFLVTEPQLAAIYQAWWQLGANDGTQATLPRWLAAHNVHAALLTDEPAVARHPLADGFAERTLLPAADEAPSAEEITDTQLARCFGAAAELTDSLPEPYCLWIHSRGMDGPWDAPYELRAQYADEEDPTPPDFTAVPEHWLAEDADPDELLGIVHAYAGQVSLVDDCLGLFLDALRESPRTERTLLAVVGSRGFPLGEHRRVGTGDESLYNELVHVPWLLRLPDGLGAMDRSSALIQPADVAATLTDWCGSTSSDLIAAGQSLLPLVRGEKMSLRDHLLLRSRSDRAIRTPAWHLRQSLASATAVELYAKPADRWEVNEVSSRLPEIAAALVEVLQQADNAANPIREPLPEALVTEVE